MFSTGTVANYFKMFLLPYIQYGMSRYFVLLFL
jgi:hypothetical protein